MRLEQILGVAAKTLLELPTSRIKSVGFKSCPAPDSSILLMHALVGQPGMGGRQQCGLKYLVSCHPQERPERRSRLLT